MTKRAVFAFLLVAALCSLLVPNAAVAAEKEEPRLGALSLVAPSCSPLILPAATTREQAILNRQARREFIAIRASVVETTPMACATPVDDEPGDPGTDIGFEAKVDGVAAAVKTCGDCPTCLSAASCNGCALGSVCSPAGAIPTRACRQVGSCTSWLGTVTYCCGCS